MVEGRGGTSQRTCMNDSWTWTMERGLTVEERVGLGGGRGKGKNWDNCNRKSNKKRIEKQYMLK